MCVLGIHIVGVFFGHTHCLVFVYISHTLLDTITGSILFVSF